MRPVLQVVEFLVEEFGVAMLVRGTDKTVKLYIYVGCTSDRAGHVRATYAGTAINRHSVKGNQ